MNFLPKSKRKGTSFDMTPMIDVVFQLLIFFLFTSRFTDVVRTPLDLPSEQGDGLLDQAADLIVDITAEGVLLIDGQQVDFRGFEQQLDAAILRFGDASLLEVLVRADKSARSETVNAVATRLAARDIRLWRLGTSWPTGGPGTGGGN